MKYKRTNVTTKEIVKYIKLKIERLRECEFGEFRREISEKEALIMHKRKAELDKLLTLINSNKILKEIYKMKRHKYTKFKMKEKNEGEK